MAVIFIIGGVISVLLLTLAGMLFSRGPARATDGSHALLLALGIIGALAAGLINYFARRGR